MCMTYLFFPRKQSVKPKPTTYQSARGIKKKGKSNGKENTNKGD
jgi:hypothetical protein